MRNVTRSPQMPACGLRSAVRLLLLASVFCAPGSAIAAIIGSNFDSGDEGWRGHACVGAGLCSVADVDWTAGLTHVQSGGSLVGGGAPVADNKYINLLDPGEVPPLSGNDFAARLEPNPTTYAGAFTYGRTVTFDALIRSNGGGGVFDDPGTVIPDLVVAPLLAIQTGAGTLVYITTDLPVIDGDWKHYAITLQENPLDTPLVDGNGWLLITDALAAVDPNPLGAAPFQAALDSQTQTTVIAEWLKEGAEVETGGIDNFQVVPIPATLPLLWAVLCGLAFTRRRHAPG